MKKVLLIIRDGWGYSKEKKGNAIIQANTPNHDFYTQEYPTAIIKCTGNDVGNPKGVQGGSEVGHLTMGAGRIVWQPYEHINEKISNEEFFKNKEIIKAIKNCKKNKSNLHLGGLFSDQGIHADYRHMHNILKLCKKEKFNRVFLHITLDGRDVPERSAIQFIKKTEKIMKKLNIGKIASLIGRFYSMDRDKNWNRTKKAYDLMTLGKGYNAKSAKEGLKEAYARQDSTNIYSSLRGDKTDYYVKPTIIINKENKPIVLLKNKDSFIWYNFRADRSRQITAMLNNLKYCKLNLKNKINVHFVGFCNYDSNWKINIAFPEQKVKNNLGYILSKNNLTQLRIAETEKYAHVTYFFNSQEDNAYKMEKRIMVPSPKTPSYDLKPKMSAPQITKKLLPQIGKYDFILVNYANPDLVGHSGVFKATVKACEEVDKDCRMIIKKALKKDYTILLTADHGNSDHMIYPNGQPDPSHGYNPILITVISNEKSYKIKKNKGLKDIAPTVLDLLDIKKPKEMSGESLIK
jgi:2,3-bisphosphoglycerate-independent phosphoglycerate mutase